jgi:hypothetical protein
MPGWIVGAQVPFLGPVVAAWIVLIVGVMASYYLLIARRHRAIGSDDRAEPRPAPAVVPLHARDTRRSDTPPGGTYDMENFPNDEWGSLSA